MTAEDYYVLGVALAERDDLAAAFEALEECVVLNPDHGPACKELARLSLQANEVRAFTNWLHEAQRIDPQDAEPHVMMAEHLVQRKRWEEAFEEVCIAKRKDPAPCLRERIGAAEASIPEYR